jgi:signal transduction histidine kinase
MNDSKTTTPQQQRLAALYEVGSRLSTTLDLGELLNLVMDATIQLTGAGRGFLVLVDQASGRLQTAAARNVDQKTISGDSMEISRGIVRQVLKTGVPVLTDNAQKDERFAEHKSVISYQLRAIMCVPLRARSQIFGAAYVDNRLFSNVFSQDDLDLLAAFAGQAAVAIENARLFRQTDRALSRRVEELTLFQRIDQELNHSLELNRVLALALEWAVKIAGADGGSIGLLEHEAEDEAQSQQFLHLLAYQGANSGAAERSIPDTHPVVAQVLREGKPIMTHGVDEGQAIDGSAAAVELAVPIKKDGTVLGLITLEQHAADAFGSEDVAFVERLADRATVAIENARLYEAVQAANDAKSEFVSLVTHELRIPLTSIRGYTDLLLKEMAGPLNDSQRQFLGTVRRNLDRMSVLIRDLSDINRVESGRMQFETVPFNLHDVLNNVAGDMQEAVEERQQTLVVTFPEEDVVVLADRTRVAQITSNLLTNANKYTPDGGTIELRVLVDAGMARVEVSDNGLGISEEEQAKLFTQFFRGEANAVREQSGWGLGLSIVKKLVQAQGGEVSCSSQPGEGSTFSFTLPLAEGAGD